MGSDDNKVWMWSLEESEITAAAGGNRNREDRSHAWIACLAQDHARRIDDNYPSPQQLLFPRESPGRPSAGITEFLQVPYP